MKLGKYGILIAYLLICGCATPGNGDSGQRVSDDEAVLEEAMAAAGEESVSGEDAAGNEVVCRREHVVGTRFARTVCRTRAQIEREQEIGREALRRQQEAAIGEFTTQRAGGG